MSPDPRPAGRPRRPHVQAKWPSLQQLSVELLDARGSVTLARFAAECHYSIAACSDATSGKRIPTEGFLRAYATATSVFASEPVNEKELLNRWIRMRRAALTERAAEKQDQPLRLKQPQKATMVRLGAAHEVSGAGQTTIQRVADPMSRRAAKRTAKRHEAIPAQPGAEDKDGQEGVVSRRLAPLVLQAVEAAEGASRDHVPVHLDPVFGALALGSTPKDLAMLLRDKITNAGLSLRDLEAGLAGRGLSVSKSTLAAKLGSGDPLISADLLAGVLRVCGARRSEINVWLYHRARIEIAGVVRTVDAPDVPDISPGIVARLTSDRMNWLHLLVASTSVVAMVLQMCIRR